MRCWAKTITCLYIISVIGCTVIYNVPSEPIEFSTSTPINLGIVLRLSKEFCNSKWEESKMGDHHILPIGKALCLNIPLFAKSIFTEVILENGEKLVAGEKPDAMLTPSLVAIERDRPNLLFATQTTSILLKWVLEDLNGSTVWVTTIAADGKGLMGHPLSKDSAYDEVEDLLHKVFDKSRSEMVNSTSIREYSVSRRDARIKH